MRSLGSYFLLVAFSTPLFEAARAWSWTGLMPSLQEQGSFRRQPWKCARKGVGCTEGCLPAGIQEPPVHYSGFGNVKKNNCPTARCRVPSGVPCAIHVISNPAVSPHSCPQAFWCWGHPVPGAISTSGGHPSRWARNTLGWWPTGSATAGLGDTFPACPGSHCPH